MNPLAILGFFASPLGRWVGIGLIGVVVFFAGELRGRRIANAKCEAAAQAAKRAADQQDAKARSEVQQQAEATINDLRSQKEKADARLVLLSQELSTRPTDAPCLYGAGGKPAPRKLQQLPKAPAPGAGDPRASGPTVISPAGRGTAGERRN